MNLKIGYDRNKKPDLRKFRFMKIGEAKNLNYGQTIWFLDIHGEARTLKVNGKPKLWKKTPRIRIPAKYGLYEFASFEKEGEDNMNFEPFLVPL